MGLFPIIMNIVQFWLIDSIVKASASAMAAQGLEPTQQDRDPLLSAPAIDDNEQPSPRSANRRRSVSSLDSRNPELQVVTSYQTTISISDEQESGSSSSTCLAGAYAYRDRLPAHGSVTTSSKSYPLIVQTSSPRFSAV